LGDTDTHTMRRNTYEALIAGYMMISKQYDEHNAAAIKIALRYKYIK